MSRARKPPLHSVQGDIGIDFVEVVVELVQKTDRIKTCAAAGANDQRLRAGSIEVEGVSAVRTTDAYSLGRSKAGCKI